MRGCRSVRHFVQPPMEWLYADGWPQPPMGWLYADGLPQPPMGWLYADGSPQPPMGWLYMCNPTIVEPRHAWLPFDQALRAATHGVALRVQSDT